MTPITKEDIKTIREVFQNVNFNALRNVTVFFKNVSIKQNGGNF